MSVVMMIIFFVLVLSDLLALAVKRCDHERARKIGAQDGQQEEFSLRIHFREFREVFTQVSLGQQVREERRHAAGHGAQSCHKPAGAALEREAQGRALRIVDVVLLEGKELAVAREASDDADLATVQPDGKRIQFFRVKLHRAAPRLYPRQGRRHRGSALRPRRIGL